jgi:hypothetical protein
LQVEAEDHVTFVVTDSASVYLLRAMKIKPLPVGFVIPLNRLKLQRRRPVLIGFTKSNTTVIG